MRFSPARFPLKSDGSTMHAYRTHTCGQLRAGDVGREVRLSGWVHRKRDHGPVSYTHLTLPTNREV